MAAVATTDVTNVETWYVPRQGLMRQKHRIVTIAMSGNGGTADDIPASVLGFERIDGAQSIRYVITSGSGLRCVPVVVEDDKLGILTINLTDTTDASRATPANVTAAGTLTVHVWGIEEQ